MAKEWAAWYLSWTFINVLLPCALVLYVCIGCWGVSHAPQHVEVIGQFSEAVSLLALVWLYGLNSGSQAGLLTLFPVLRAAILVKASLWAVLPLTIIFCWFIVLYVLSIFLFCCRCCCLFFKTNSPCSPGSPETHRGNQAGLTLTDLLASASGVLGWRPAPSCPACTSLYSPHFYPVCDFFFDSLVI